MRASDLVSDRIDHQNNPGGIVTDQRADLALRLAQQAVEASEKFKTKSPETAELAALTSIALSLSQIAEALAQRSA